LILGPLEVEGADGNVATGGRRQRLVLALLVAAANRVVQVDALIDDLWGDRAPGRPRKTVQVYVSNLRRALGPGHGIETVLSGYRLSVQPGEVDADAFETLVARGRALTSSDPGAALRAYRAAEALWRGEPFADLGGCEALGPLAVRLNELCADAVDERIGLELDLGRSADAVAELEALVRSRPLREWTWALLMRALYLAGRQSDALTAYQRARRLLIDQVGVEPGTDLAEMEQRVLAHDPSLDPAGGPALGAGGRHGPVGPDGPDHRRASDEATLRAQLLQAGREQHRVTTLCCAATGIEAIAEAWDPVDLVDLLNRFRRAVVLVLVDHGGLVASSAAPAIVAHFGVAVGENQAPIDAVLAGLAVVTAAATLRFDGLPPPPAGWGAQIGIDTGTALARRRSAPTSSGRAPPLGAVPMLADRLRARATPGQVLITTRTAHLVRGHVRLGAGADHRAGGDGPVVAVPVLPPPHGRRRRAMA
jgi:DNA-binding SARP family transcriptional activator